MNETAASRHVMNETAASRHGVHVVEERIRQSVAVELQGVELVCDPAGVLYCPAQRLLVVSDLHLEKGSAFARRGMMLPPYDTAATLALLSAAIDCYDPGVIISLGDSFHDQRGAADMPAPFRDAITGLSRGRSWYWIAGNHDPDPPPGMPGDWASQLSISGLVFRHEPLAGSCDGEIAGHLHPCARIVRRGKAVRRPCFASDGKRMVMPAFGVLSGGLDLAHPAFQGLFERSALTAHLLGRDRLYSVRFSNFVR